MAEAIVSLVVERIADLLIKEAAYLSGVKGEVIRLRDELRRMKCFLKDADRVQDQDERVHNWISEIRDLAYDAEDVIDTFILQASTGTGVSGLIKSSVSIISKGYHYHKLRNQTESIQTKIRDISAGLQTYGIKPIDAKEGSTSNSEMRQLLRRSYPHEEEEYVIGLDSVISEVKDQLLKEEERLSVVSIVGMGGLGKTTLAKRVYNSTDVKRHFDCHSWAFVSQQFFTKDILVKILTDVASSVEKENLEKREEKDLFERMKDKQSFKKSLEELKEEDLIEYTYQVLKEKKYLVVLDDIWSNEAWDCLKHAFPKGKKGSKILFTTRNRNVALYADSRSCRVELPPLTNDQGWELLSRKVFLNDIISAYGDMAEFEKVGKDMVEKCQALPLAVVVLGGVLATKKSLREWNMVQRNINAQFSNVQKTSYGVYGILAMSYQDLPFHLKPCFLHLSQYPEDWEFHKRSVIRLWIAEGFVPQPSQANGEETIEDVAEQYLEELVSRSIIQVRKRDHTGIGVKIFQMHDLMRDMCISKARDENFAAITEEVVNTPTNSSSHLARRIAVHPCTSRDHGGKLFCTPLVKCGESNVRSLIYFVEGDMYHMSRGDQKYIHKNFKLLRILNLSGIRLQNHSIHRSIGNLIHLRYLGLRYAELEDGLFSAALPGSIGNLKNLYTLDLRDSFFYLRDNYVYLSKELWKLENLRHLLLDYDYIGSIGLKNLETLKMVRAKNLIRKNSIMKFPNLRNLGIYMDGKKEGGVVLESSLFRSESHLRCLKMVITGINRLSNTFPSLESLFSCHHLTKLKLNGKISNNQRNLEFLPKNLIKLSLVSSYLEQDSMGNLEKLPNLRFLSLDCDSYVGSKMVCSVNGFSKLEILKLSSLWEVEEWEIEEGAMPCLKTLHIFDPEKLKMIPEGLKFVTTLQELKFTFLKEGQELKQRVVVNDGVEGEDFHKIRHIPSILIV